MQCNTRRILYEMILLLFSVALTGIMMYLVFSRVDMITVICVFFLIMGIMICIRNCCCKPGPEPVHYTEPVPVAIPVQPHYILIMNPHRTITIGQLYRV